MTDSENNHRGLSHPDRPANRTGYPERAARSCVFLRIFSQRGRAMEEYKRYLKECIRDP